jgi:hypothetical protein
MRTISKMTVAMIAAMLFIPVMPMPAQPPDAGAAAAGQARGARGGRNGFGGMGTPVQGVVTAASGGKVTIKTAAGDTYDVTLIENGRAIKDRQPIQLSDIKTGDSVTAMGQVDAAKKTIQAMMLMDVDAATMAKARENLGKTYIVGRITAIDADNLKLTVMRQDDVSQVIAVDEGTSFQRGMRGVAAEIAAAGGMGGGGFGGRGMGAGAGGARPGGGQAAAQAAPESITLADIKVGDMIAATGSVKNGSFTAQKMGVMQPGAGARNGGRMGPGAGATGSGAGGAADRSPR